MGFDLGVGAGVVGEGARGVVAAWGDGGSGLGLVGATGGAIAGASAVVGRAAVALVLAAACGSVEGVDAGAGKVIEPAASGPVGVFLVLQTATATIARTAAIAAPSVATSFARRDRRRGMLFGVGVSIDRLEDCEAIVGASASWPSSGFAEGGGG